MKIPSRLVVLFAGLPLALSAAQSWQEVIVPSVAEAAAAFPSPPKEYGAIHWATGFPAPKERIMADIDNTADIAFVMKGGELVDESKLPLAGGKQPRRFAP